jgi:hypothetical protein
MSNVFKRPMFRRGGEVGGGIMTGIVDREMHALSDPNGVGGQTPTPSERIAEALKKYEEPAFDPVAQLLIQGGLRGMSQTGGGSVAANLAKAFEGPTEKFFETAQKRKDVQREVALAGVEADIGADLQRQKLDEEAKQALLQREFVAAQGDLDRQNEIRKEIIKGQNKIDELQFMIDNPEADPAKKGVIPSPETRVSDLTQVFMENDNPALSADPELHANNIIRFRVNASPETQSKFKGYVKYNYNIKDPTAPLIPIPPRGKPGDIVYDPGEVTFKIFDNQGELYNLNPLTYDAEER